MAADTAIDVTSRNIWLRCPYERRGTAKAYGGAWIRDARAWRYPREIQIYEELREAFPDATLSDAAAQWVQEAHARTDALIALRQRTDAPLEHRHAAAMRPYQRVGVDFLRRADAAILGDEPGLGKTFQTIAAADLLPGELCMVVLPSTLHGTWAREFAQWSQCPQTFYSVLPKMPKAARDSLVNDWLHGSGRRWLLVHYEALRLLPKISKTIDIFIADEAHRAKHRSSQQSKVIAALKRRRTFLLTGTPVHNTPDDLWHLLHLLDAKEFNSYWRFVGRYCTVKKIPIGDGRTVLDITGAQRVEELQNVLAPYMLRRLKSEHLQELPEKIHVPVPVQLSGRHLKLYRQMEKESLALLTSGEMITAPLAISQHLRLRQIAATPRSLGDDTDGAKIDWIVEHLQDTGKKLVVFSQFRTVIDAAAARLEKEGVRYVRITGAESMEERQESVRVLQTSPEQVVCLCTIQAGGVGLTLTAADEVVFIDRAWVPADNVQAEDRLHRIGQLGTVLVYILIAQDTVDEDMFDDNTAKQRVADQILETILARRGRSD